MLCNWIDAVNHGAVDPVVAMYTNDASLFPTFSPSNRQGKKDIEGYFQNLLNKTTHTTCRVTESTLLYLSDDVVLCTGMYTFAQDDLEFPARFTFVVRVEDNVWKIMHHHSSCVPDDA